MISLDEARAELDCARATRLAAEAAGCEMEALVRDMQRCLRPYRPLVWVEAGDPGWFDGEAIQAQGASRAA